MIRRGWRFGVLGCVVSGVACATSPIQLPHSIAFQNDAQVTVSVSKEDLNRIFVVGDPIVSVNAPEGRFRVRHDASGSLYSTTRGTAPFTVFLSTRQGRHVALRLVPTHCAGAVIRLVPTLPPPLVPREALTPMQLRGSEQDEHRLIRFLGVMMQGKLPDGFTAVPHPRLCRLAACRVRVGSGSKALRFRVVGSWASKRFGVLIQRLHNTTHHRITLHEARFYRPHVRLIALSRNRVLPNQSSSLFEVIRLG